MNFLGDGYVELRTPTNLEDLKAYTELSLSLQRPLGEKGRGDGDGSRRRRQGPDDPSDMFVMYLGNKDVSWLAGRTVVASYKVCYWRATVAQELENQQPSGNQKAAGSITECQGVPEQDTSPSPDELATDLHG